MTTKNKIEKDYKDKLDELSPEEVSSILDNLIKDFYKAFSVYNLPKMKQIYNEIDEIIDLFKTKYNNIENYCNARKIFYNGSLTVLRERKHALLYLDSKFAAVLNIYIQLAENHKFLMHVLNTYFFNHGNDEDLMKRLDGLIGMIRDNILRLLDNLENYDFRLSKETQENIIQSHKEFIHEIIEERKYRFMKELGAIDVEMDMIKSYNTFFKVGKECNMIKEEIDDMFEGDNGFKHIIKAIECDMNGIPEEKLDELIFEYPRYNVMETKYIPKTY